MSSYPQAIAPVSLAASERQSKKRKDKFCAAISRLSGSARNKSAQLASFFSCEQTERAAATSPHRADPRLEGYPFSTQSHRDSRPHSYSRKASLPQYLKPTWQQRWKDSDNGCNTTASEDALAGTSPLTTPETEAEAAVSSAALVKFPAHRSSVKSVRLLAPIHFVDAPHHSGEYGDGQAPLSPVKTQPQAGDGLQPDTDGKAIRQEEEAAEKEAQSPRNEVLSSASAVDADPPNRHTVHYVKTSLAERINEFTPTPTPTVSPQASFPERLHQTTSNHLASLTDLSTLLRTWSKVGRHVLDAIQGTHWGLAASSLTIAHVTLLLAHMQRCIVACRLWNEHVTDVRSLAPAAKHHLIHSRVWEEYEAQWRQQSAASLDLDELDSQLGAIKEHLPQIEALFQLRMEDGMMLKEQRGRRGLLLPWQAEVLNKRRDSATAGLAPELRRKPRGLGGPVSSLREVSPLPRMTGQLPYGSPSQSGGLQGRSGDALALAGSTRDPDGHGEIEPPLDTPKTVPPAVDPRRRSRLPIRLAQGPGPSEAKRGSTAARSDQDVKYSANISRSTPQWTWVPPRQSA